MVCLTQTNGRNIAFMNNIGSSVIQKFMGTCEATKVLKKLHQESYIVVSRIPIPDSKLHQLSMLQ